MTTTIYTLLEGHEIEWNSHYSSYQLVIPTPNDPENPQVILLGTDHYVDALHIAWREYDAATLNEAGEDDATSISTIVQQAYAHHGECPLHLPPTYGPYGVWGMTLPDGSVALFTESLCNDETYVETVPTIEAACAAAARYVEAMNQK